MEQGMLVCCNGHCCAELNADAEDEQITRTFVNSSATQTPCIQKTSPRSGDVRDDCLDRQRKLVLHFDVRNTILVSDSATHDNVEQALNSFLTGVTWGREEPGVGWVWYSDHPSLRAPCPGVITYYKNRERELVRCPADRVRLRRITSDFTRQPIGRKFRKYFEAHLRLLEWNVVTISPQTVNIFNPDSTVVNLPFSANNAPTTTKPEADRTKPEVVPLNGKPEVNSVDRKLTIVGANGRLYHYILPSFIKMIYDLHAEGCRFSVILRTYGVDAPKVLDSIAHIVAGNHPLFPDKLPINVNCHPGRICRQSSGLVRCELPPTAATSPPTVLDTDADIYHHMSNVEGICGFVDDFEYWQRNNYAHSDGKPLWVDLDDQEVQHIFFDDNIRVADSEGIVDLRLFHQDSSSGCGTAAVRSLSIEEIAPLENVCLVQADLLECTSNMDYFINAVRQCRLNYSNLLHQRQSSYRDV